MAESVYHFAESVYLVAESVFLFLKKKYSVKYCVCRSFCHVILNLFPSVWIWKYCSETVSNFDTLYTCINKRDFTLPLELQIVGDSSSKENGMAEKTETTEKTEKISSTRENIGKLNILNLQNITAGNSLVHIDQLDYSVKRSGVPVTADQHIKARPDSVKKRSPCSSEHKRRRTLHRIKSKDVRATKKSLLLASRLIEKIKQHTRPFNRLSNSDSEDLSRLPETEKSPVSKKSRMKEMRIHNKLGGIRIKSDPTETALISESGNIEITMENEVGKASQANKKGVVSLEKLRNGAVKREGNIINDKKAKVEDEEENEWWRATRKNRIHIAEEDIGVKKSSISSKHHLKHIVDDMTVKRYAVNSKNRLTSKQDVGVKKSLITPKHSQQGASFFMK